MADGLKTPRQTLRFDPDDLAIWNVVEWQINS